VPRAPSRKEHAARRDAPDVDGTQLLVQPDHRERVAHADRVHRPRSREQHSLTPCGRRRPQEPAPAVLTSVGDLDTPPSPTRVLELDLLHGDTLEPGSDTVENARMALFTPAERERTTERVSELLSADERIAGVLLVGSLVRGSDRWSDIDLEVVVAGGADHSRVAADWVDRLYEKFPVVHHYETAFGDNLVRGLLLENLLELDLAFTPAASFSVWGPARIMFDRSGALEAAVASPVDWGAEPPNWASEAGFAWHDVLHAGTAVRRGRPWQGLWYLQRIRSRTLGLAQERRGFYADFFDYVDDLPEEELAPQRDTLVSTLDPEALLRAIEVATRLFLEELRRGDPELAERMEGPLLEFVQLRS
jgi:predicted nucleotidyltransferase